MGLIKENYTIKATGITIPTAYAMVQAMQIQGKRARAIVAIQQSREANSTLRALETVIVEFNVVRNESPFITAYRALKADVKAKVRNPETGRLELAMVPSPFIDWTDDIQGKE